MSIVHKISNLLFPVTCRICGGKSETTVCDKCKELFIKETFEHCPVCGMTAMNCSCGSDFSKYTKTEIYGRKSIALSFYKTANSEDRLTEKMIFMLKDRGEFSHFFAEELSRSITMLFIKAKLDISEWTVTYIPRSEEKYSSYGFDQGEEVARHLAKHLGIKFARTFNRDGGTAQKNLGAKKRMENAEKTLIPRRRSIKRGAKYLLFDDIITTGASVETAAKHLYYYGADTVFPIVIAKRSISKTKFNP